MSLAPILIFVHILLMVFWLGTDVGVFASALRYIDPRLSLAERKAVMDLGILIDRLPRVCFVGMFPVGLQIAALYQIVAIPLPVLVFTWVLAACWMFIVLRLIALGEAPAAHRFRQVERVLQTASGSALFAIAIAGLTGVIAMPGWFVGKLIAFGAICFFGLVLDVAFAPVVTSFAAIAAQGSTPERERELRTRMWGALRWVLVIYAAVLVAGFLGTVRP